MNEDTISMKTRTTRRTVLAGFSTLLAAGAGGAALAAPAPVAADDPVFAAIARHKDLHERWRAAAEAHDAIADELWQQAEFTAQTRTEERAAYLAAHPEEASQPEFRQADDELFCEHRTNAARELVRDNPEYHASQALMQEAAEAEREAAVALATVMPVTSGGATALAQYAALDEVKLALERA